MRPGSPVGYARARRAAGAWEETLDAFIVTLGVAAPLWPLVFEGVAHDFNNLLAAIRGYAELAARQGSDRPRLLESLEGITTTVGRASSLIRQLLAFSRRQRLEPKVVDLNDVVIGSLGLIERVTREDIRLETDLAEGVPNVKADPDQLTHVLLNLAVNARDAMAAAGRSGSRRRPSTRTGQRRSLAAAPGGTGRRRRRLPAQAVRLVRAPGACRVAPRAASRGVGFSAERQGPVAQPVFKTGEVWQPQAG